MLAQARLRRLVTGKPFSSSAALTRSVIPPSLRLLALSFNWPRARIARKVVLPYALLAIVLGAVVTYIATDLVAGSLEERFDNQLLEAGRVASDAVARKEQEHIEAVRAIAFTRGLPEATLGRDTTAIGNLIAGYVANRQTERLDVLGLDGQRLKSIELMKGDAVRYAVISDEDSPADWHVVQSILNDAGTDAREKYTEIVSTAGGPFVYTAGPIFSDGSLVGVVLVGTSLESFLGEIKGQAMADFTVYGADGAVLGTTFPVTENSGSEARELVLHGRAASAISASDQVLREHHDLWGRGYDVLVTELTLRGRPVGYYSVALPTDYIFTAANTTRWQIALIFGLAIAAMLSIGLLLSQTLTRPILALARTADRVSRGDFTARTEVTSIDEVGRLTVRINQMTDKLEGQYLGTLRALASAVASKDSYTLGHSVRVGQLAAMLGRRLGLDDRTIAYLEVGGYLHDVGGIGIRSKKLRADAIPPEERHLLESHPHIELTVCEQRCFPGREPYGLIAGDGAPFAGARAEEGGDLVTLVSKIVPVADLYDALRGDHVEHPRVSMDDALAVVRAQAGVALHFGTVEKLAEAVTEWEERVVAASLGGDAGRT